VSFANCGVKEEEEEAGEWSCVSGASMVCTKSDVSLAVFTSAKTWSFVRGTLTRFLVIDYDSRR
jgi:hypothetical protein